MSKNIPFEKSFASHEKAKFWHLTKNNGLLAENVSKCSNKKYWFHCQVCDHDFDKSLNHIVKNGWCNYCSGHKITECYKEKCDYCYERLFISHEKSNYWHVTKNGKITPKDIKKSSKDSYWFTCNICNHDFESRISDVSRTDGRNNWCPYCSVPIKKFCKDNCDFCYEKSFASCEKSNQWHPTKNGNIIPRNITKGNQIKCWFKCDICSHSFLTNVYSVAKTKSDKNYCPYCNGVELCEDESCDFCHKNSFASCEKSNQWHQINNGVVKPRNICKFANTKYWFKCDVCNHDFKSLIANVSYGYWCPYCCIHCKTLCDDRECKFCHKKSFAINPRSEFWHYNKNKNINPRDVFKSSGNKYWFTCNICSNDFKMCLRDINRGSWCPVCVNKTEKKLHHWITERKDEFEYIHYQIQFKPTWADLRKSHNTHYIYDFYIEINDVKIIIELDGPQHYKQVSNWRSPLYNQIRDKIKERLATKQYINIIRLNQEDVFNDKGNWGKELLDCIQSIKENSDEIVIYNLVNEERYTNE